MAGVTNRYQQFNLAMTLIRCNQAGSRYSQRIRHLAAFNAGFTYALKLAAVAATSV
jgi:hypothetical protein